VILVDTSIWIDFLIDPTRLPEVEVHLPDVVTCGPVVQEVTQGFADENLLGPFRERLLAIPCLSDPLPLALFLEGASIYRSGRRRGYTIRSTVDCLIAAIAIDNDVPVWHRDRDFTAIARYTPLKVFSRAALRAPRSATPAGSLPDRA
jgi:predicted nucleic acid-binding protein